MPACPEPCGVAVTRLQFSLTSLERPGLRAVKRAARIPLSPILTADVFAPSTILSLTLQHTQSPENALKRGCAKQTGFLKEVPETDMSALCVPVLHVNNYRISLNNWEFKV